MKKTLTTTSRQDIRSVEAGERTRDRKVFTPRADIVENKNALMVVVDMPGVDEKSVDITLERNILSLRGTMAKETPSGYELEYSEYDMGDYLRVFTLSDEVRRDGIQATVRNGVLRLLLPKADPARKIAVQAG